MGDWDEPTAAPSGDRVDIALFVNKLIIVRPLEYVESMVTIHKKDGAEAVFADVAFLDAYEGQPYKIFRRVLFMQGYLVGSFKASVGKRLLGTLTLGVATKGKPPYHFKSLTDNPKAAPMASAWWKDHETEFMTQPEPVFDDAKPSAETQRQSDPWGDEPPF